jgi:CheY-like chemotaxis protein
MDRLRRRFTTMGRAAAVTRSVVGSSPTCGANFLIILPEEPNFRAARLLASFPGGLNSVSNILESQDYSDGVNSPRQLEVLVVQSNPADPVPTLEAFKVAGATNGLNCVMDGDDALMYVRREGKYAQKAIPDLIFLDLSQPRTSGLEFLKILKSTESLIHIPIVVRAG